MAGVWEYNCPQYVDFTNLQLEDDNDADEWFEMEHETTEQAVAKIEKKRVLSEFSTNIKNSAMTPKILKYTPKNKLNQEKYSTPPQTLDENDPPNKHKVKTGRTPLTRLNKSASKEEMKLEKKDAVTETDDDDTYRIPKQSASALGFNLTGAARIAKTAFAGAKGVMTFSAISQARANANSGQKRASSGKTASASLTKLLRRSPRLIIEKCMPAAKFHLTPSSPATKRRKSETGFIGIKSKPRRSTKSTTETRVVQPTKHTVGHIEGPSENCNPLDSKASIRRHLAVQRKLAQMNEADAKRGPLKANPSLPKVSTQAQEVINFPSTLRKSTTTTVTAKSKERITQPVPFKLTEPKKPKIELEVERYRSLAEQVIAYEKRTPRRYHTRSKHGSLPSPESQKSDKSLRIVIPKTPNLTSRFRNRPVTASSREQLEEEELQAIQRNQFKARPVNPDIFKVKEAKIESKPVTVPEPFKLTAPPSNTKVVPEEDKYEFRARPVPRAILEGPQGIAPAKEIPLTTPHTPQFVWTERLRQRSRSLEKPMAQMTKEVRPKPSTPSTALHQGVPFKVKLEKKFTSPAPFSFDDKDRVRIAKREEKIKEILEQEKKMREFHAHPVPKLEEPTGIPEKLPFPLTELQPFSFLNKNKGIERGEKWKSELEMELKRQKEQAVFKARPNKVIYSDPFIPEKSSKPLTDVLHIQLKTTTRAQSREEYDQWLKSREAEVEAQRRRLEAEREEEERQRIAKQRKEAVHKANPVRHYRPVEIRPCPNPLTVPQSPHFNKNKTQ